MRFLNHLPVPRHLALLPVAAGTAILGCLVYCAVWWDPHPMTRTDLDCSWACWGFCATLSPFWGSIAALLALGLIVGGLGEWRQPGRWVRWTLVFGLLTLPFGAAGFAPLVARHLGGDRPPG